MASDQPNKARKAHVAFEWINYFNQTHVHVSPAIQNCNQPL